MLPNGGNMVMNNVLKSIAVLVMTLTITFMGKIFGLLDAKSFDQNSGLVIFLLETQRYEISS
jgi:hypothetical protein